MERASCKSLQNNTKGGSIKVNFRRRVTRQRENIRLPSAASQGAKLRRQKCARSAAVKTNNAITRRDTPCFAQ